ncbi:MAG TPA: YraN family protein [Candidatus Saccharimonadales bacterium]|nr:YraN family protein [Candidatus Saccharimonadales bacterium]
MTNYAHGHEAEKYAAEYLKQQGYKILELNWRRPQAEIDIVACQKHEPITFIEVKYRESAGQGGGLDYITPRKLDQMRFAAELWVNEHRYDGEYVLAAIEVAGLDYKIAEFIESLT